MVSKLQAFLDSNKQKPHVNIFFLLLFFISSGCATTSSVISSIHTGPYEAGDYESFIKDPGYQRKYFDPKVQNTIIRESIDQIRKGSTENSDMYGLRKAYLQLAHALIESGHFKQASQVCAEGIEIGAKLEKALSERIKKDWVSGVSYAITNYILDYSIQPEYDNRAFMRRMFLYKAYITWFTTGNKEKAFNVFEEFLTRDSSGEDRTFLLMDRGHFYGTITGDYRKSLDQFIEASKLVDNMHVSNTDMKYMYLLQIYGKIADLNIKLGELRKSEEALLECEQKSTGLSYRIGKLISGLQRTRTAVLKVRIAKTYALMRDFNMAKKYFDEAYETIGKVDPQSKDYRELEALSAYYIFYGAYYLGLQGNYAAAVQNVDKGLHYLRPYYLESIQEEPNIETAYLFSSELHFILGEYETALQFADKAIEYSKRYYNDAAVLNADILRGQIYFKKGEKQKAKQIFEKALDLSRGKESTENWKLYYALGQVYENLGNENDGLKYYKKAVDEVEKLWKGRFADNLKQVSFIDNRLIVFEPVIRILAKQGKADEVVKYMELSKARTFFETTIFDSDNIKGPAQSQIAQKEDKEAMRIQAEISSLSEKIGSLSAEIQKIDDTLDESRRVASSRGVAGVKEISKKEKSETKVKPLSSQEKKKLEAEKRVLVKEMDAYQKKFNELSAAEQKLLDQNSQSGVSLGSISTLNASQIRNFLPDNISIIEYYVGEQTVVGAVINKKGVNVKELPITSEALKENVMAFREALGNFNYNYKDWGVALYDDLIQPFQKHLFESDTICIVPHGVLHYLPFQTLIAIDNSEKGKQKELIEKEKMLMASLGQTIKQNRGVKGTREISTVSLAKSNITTSKVKTADSEIVRAKINEHRAMKGIPANRPMFLIDEFKIFYAPSSSILSAVHKSNSNKKTKLLAAGSPPPVDIRDLGIKGQDLLDKLPSTKTEIKEVSSLFPDKTVFTDEAATETVVKNNASQSDILLFSTHGLLIRKDPLRSSIFFNKDQLNDGRLTVQEIEALNLKANLAVLSACETGLVSGYEGISENVYDAKFPHGDDLVGLQRAFLRSGASSVLSTLWQVADESTSSLVVDFFKRYQNGKNKTDALQEAQLALMNSRKEWEHPYFWAPFVLSGDWR